MYRLNNERTGEDNRLLELREIAALVHEHSPQDLSIITEQLCWIGLKYAFPLSHRKEYWKEHGTVIREDGGPDRKVELKPNRGVNLLAAATYLNLMPLALQLLKDGHAPDIHNYMFPSALEAAAWAGHEEMVGILQNHIANQPDFDNLDITAKWIKLAGKRVIMGAAIRGDLAFLKRTMYPPALGSPSETTLAGQQIGQISRESTLGSAIYAAQRCTNSPEIHKYLQSFLNESFTDLTPNWFSRDSATTANGETLPWWSTTSTMVSTSTLPGGMIVQQHCVSQLKAVKKRSSTFSSLLVQTRISKLKITPISQLYL